MIEHIDYTAPVNPTTRPGVRLALAGGSLVLVGVAGGLLAEHTLNERAQASLETVNDCRDQYPVTVPDLTMARCINGTDIDTSRVQIGNTLVAVGTDAEAEQAFTTAINSTQEASEFDGSDALLYGLAISGALIGLAASASRNWHNYLADRFPAQETRDV